VTDYHINVFYSDEDGGYIADIPDLEACSAFGASPEEALAEVAKGKDAWLAGARDAGKQIPEPRYRPRSTRSRRDQSRQARSNASNVAVRVRGVPPRVPSREQEEGD
jgi:predicted RNase H-like HicB family nuclease